VRADCAFSQQEVDPQTHGANSAMDLQDALAEVAILQETVTQLTAILDAVNRPQRNGF
jgi:hypothetical protein